MCERKEETSSINRYSSIANPIFGFIVLWGEKNNAIHSGQRHNLIEGHSKNDLCPKIFVNPSVLKLQKWFLEQTSLPYFGVKLIFVCLMFAYKKKYL